MTATLNTQLPPPLPTGFNPGAAVGGGATAAPAGTTQPVPTTTTPSTAPSSCGGGAVGQGGTTVQAGGALAAPTTVPTAGTNVGGAMGGGTTALQGAITSLTTAITALSSAIGGVAGGGPATKAGGDATQTPPVAGGGAAPTTPAPTTPTAPVAGAVAGANGGAPATGAVAGASNVQGGGAAIDNSALVQAIQGVVTALTAVIQALQAKIQGGAVAGTTGGGAPGKTPEQTGVKGASGAPDKTPPAKSDVGGKKGDAVQQSPAQKTPAKAPVTPAQVAGTSGAGKPEDKAPTKNPSEVKGAAGGPAQKTPPVVPGTPPPAVLGASGPGQTPGQQPTQSPVQSPVQAPTQVGGVKGGTVTIDNDDKKYSVKLTSKEGKNANSVEMWGDPHIVTNIDGKEERFDIGYGPGSFRLQDGTTISWDTFPKGHDKQYVMKDFKIDAQGVEYDRSVTTADGKNESGVTTSLTDAQLKEFAAELKNYKAAFSTPLTRTGGTPEQK